jgi:predicted dehydrogenase
MLNWGLIGAGGIARVFANGLRFSETGRAVAVASQTAGKAEAFARDFGIPKSYTTYDALLADPEIGAVYISTIHPFHAACAVQAARAGKHILVEKPLALNAAEAAGMIAAARANDVFLMEAFMYRCHPQTQKLAELVRAGAVGRVQVIRAVFSFGATFTPNSRTFARELGGGGIMDVGCYTASMARLIAGAAAGQPFAEPMVVKGCGVLGPTGVDHYAAATLQFESGIVAEIITGVTCRMPAEVAVYGEAGALTVANPWLPASPCRSAKLPLPLDTRFPPVSIALHTYRTGQTEEIVIQPDRDLFTYEADTVAAHLADRQAPAMSWDDTLGNMLLLDRWRAEVGVVYPQDAAGHIQS